MMYYVYAISSLVKPYTYVGITNNINRRLTEHQAGKNRSTKAYLPFKLIYTGSHKNSVEARYREKFLKSGVGRKWLNNL